MIPLSVGRETAALCVFRQRSRCLFLLMYRLSLATSCCICRHDDVQLSGYYFCLVNCWLLLSKQQLTDRRGTEKLVSYSAISKDKCRPVRMTGSPIIVGVGTITHKDYEYLPDRGDTYLQFPTTSRLTIVPN